MCTTARSLQRLHVLTDVVDPEEGSAPLVSKHSDGDTRCDRAGESIGITELPTEEALSGRSHEHRPAKGHELVEAGKLDVVLQVLAEADPGVETDVLFGNPGRDGEGEPVIQEGLHVRDDVLVARFVLHRPRLAEHVHETEIGTRIRNDPGELGSPRSAVTSLTMTAPSSRARRATTALEVSTETAKPWSRSSTGSTRRSSSLAETPSEPGRVDSPPTSTTAAPSSR